MYLERFTLPDAEQEEELIMERICETRDCAGFVDNPYPCRLFPARGLRELYFQNMTILYGGNGSGKSTLLNLIAEKLKLNRIAPFNSGEMVKAYVDACCYEMAFDDEGFRHTVPDGSRIITMRSGNVGRRPGINGGRCGTATPLNSAGGRTTIPSGCSFWQEAGPFRESSSSAGSPGRRSN